MTRGQPCWFVVVFVGVGGDWFVLVAFELAAFVWVAFAFMAFVLIRVHGVRAVVVTKAYLLYSTS